MTTITAPITAFADAARHPGMVWLESGAPARVCHGPQAPAGALPLRGALLDALAAAYGDDAAALAWREAGAARDATALPAVVLRHIIGCAESLGSLTDAQGLMLQLEWSATLLGRRFVALCAEQGVVAAELPLAHRQAIDEAVRRDPAHEPVALRLARLIARPPVH